MPVRFQVDPDFYDHPKVTGMSDAAFSLWVRAGSFSAAKLTDGFISEDVLVYTLRSSEDVADELARRGLWRRTKGGWRFHQWDGRNLTRKRVEDDKKADAERKRLARKQRADQQSKPTSEYGEHTDEYVDPVDNDSPHPVDELQVDFNDKNAQVGSQNVRPDSTRTLDGIQLDSQRNPDVSVSVSESVSSSSTSVGRVGYVPARASAPPPRCSKHMNQPALGSCRPCGDARQARQAWDEQQAEAAHRERIAVGRCRLCDGDGRRWDPVSKARGTVGPCDHRPLGASA